MSKNPESYRRESYWKEFWVGGLVLLVVVLMAVFGSLIGLFGTWTGGVRWTVGFDFVGGLEVGSPVRVAGVKVGRVERIAFVSGEPAEPSLKVDISVSKAAAKAVRTDSRFYINMAGIIGERYLEISPGKAEPLAPGAPVRGVDPPRIDQLLSQSYAVFGRVADFLDEKQGVLSELVDQFSLLVTDMNEFLKGRENRKAFFTVLSNLSVLTSELRDVVKDPKGRAFFRALDEVIQRAQTLDGPALKKFLQEEGVRARIF